MADGGTVSLYADTPPEHGSLKRIRRLSRPFEIGFALLAGLVVAFSLVILVMAFAPGGPFVFVSPDGAWLVFDPARAPDGAVAFRGLPLSGQLAGLFTGALIYSALIAAFIFLSRLFGCYRRGVVFAAAPTRLMRRAGVALVLFAAAPGMMQPLIRSAGAVDENWFHIYSVAAFLVGVSLFLFSHVIALGAEIERESKGFV